jgi:hypothetical protein
MPAPSKIQNEGEAVRWIEEGKTYTWMVDKYREKYGIETTVSMWGNFRRRKGLDARIVRDDNLIPWAVQKDHRWHYAVQMLRMEARRRAGAEIGEDYERDLDSWLERLKEDNAVVHYDPDTDEGFFYVPRRPGVDKDLIREPGEKSGRRSA